MTYSELQRTLQLPLSVSQLDKIVYHFSTQIGLTVELVEKTKYSLC
jgi:hypothetical protein